MAKINLAEDVVPIGEFKTHASELIRKLKGNRRALVITQHGRASAVVISPEEFERLGERMFVRSKIEAGERSAQLRTYSIDQVASTLKERIRAKAKTR